MLYDDGFEDFCYENCLNEYFNITTCSEVDYIDCRMNPKRMFDLEYLVPVSCLFFFIFLSGLIGNLCVCTVIARHPVLRLESNMYLFSLAVSDLLLLVFGLPQEVWGYWHKYPYIFGDFLCRFMPFMSATGTYSSVLTIVAFSVERYEAICHPLLSRSKSGKRVAITLCATWTISAAVSLPILHVYNIERRLPYPPSNSTSSSEEIGSELSSICIVPNETTYDYYEYFYIGNSVIFFFIPMVVLLIAYTKIALFLWKNRQLSRNCGIQNSCSENRRIFKNLAAVVLAFFVCSAPYHYQRVFTPHKKDPQSKEDRAHYQHVLVVTGIFYYFSATINCVLYNAMSKRYRYAFKDIFWKKNDSQENTSQPARTLKYSGKSTTQTLIN